MPLRSRSREIQQRVHVIPLGTALSHRHGAVGLGVERHHARRSHRRSRTTSRSTHRPVPVEDGRRFSTAGRMAPSARPNSSEPEASANAGLPQTTSVTVCSTLRGRAGGVDGDRERDRDRGDRNRRRRKQVAAVSATPAPRRSDDVGPTRRPRPPPWRSGRTAAAPRTASAPIDRSSTPVRSGHRSRHHPLGLRVVRPAATSPALVRVLTVPSGSSSRCGHPGSGKDRESRRARSPHAPRSGSSSTAACTRNASDSATV